MRNERTATGPSTTPLIGRFQTTVRKTRRENPGLYVLEARRNPKARYRGNNKATERAKALTIAFNLVLRVLHLAHESCVTNDSSCITDFAACLVEAGNCADYGTLCDVSESHNLLEGLARGKFSQLSRRYAKEKQVQIE